jgi:hypothetical protein
MERQGTYQGKVLPLLQHHVIFCAVPVCRSRCRASEFFYSFIIYFLFFFFYYFTLFSSFTVTEEEEEEEKNSNSKGLQLCQKVCQMPCQIRFVPVIIGTRPPTLALW